MSQLDRLRGVVGSVAIKVPCRAASTTALTLSGEQTVAGITCITGDRVLVKDQSASADNGVYVVDTGDWERAADFDGAQDVVMGTIVPVYSGLGTYESWVVVSDDPQPGATDLLFELITAASLAASLSASSGSSMVGFIQSGTGPISQTSQDKGRETLSLFDFYSTAQKAAIRAGTPTDVTTAFALAIAEAQASNRTLNVNPGPHVIASPPTVTGQLSILGAGWMAQLLVDSAASATTDLLLIRPSSASAVQGFHFANFFVGPVSGTPGRYAFNIDGTDGPISNMVFDHVRINALGSYAIAITNASGLTTGSPFTTTVRDCAIAGGVDLSNGGDSINLQNNVFSGARDLKIGLIGAATSSGGAHGFLLLNNNITTTGGTIITNAWQGTIAYNNFEQVAVSTEANNALLDIQGNASANVENVKIYGNFLGADSTKVADTIRVDRATCTEIRDNYAIRGSGVTYRITANAIRTHIAHDRQALDEALTVVLADLGTATTVEILRQTSGIRTFTPSLQMSDNSGNSGIFMSATQMRYAANRVMGWVASTTDPATALIAGFTGDTVTGEVNLGNGSANDTSGHLIQTSGIDLGTQSTKRIRLNRGTALVAGDFALSGGWGNTAAVSAVIGTDQAWTITVTANGTGIAASPTITLTFHDGTFTNSPITNSKMSGGTGTITALTETPTATTNVITFNGTPGAGSTYIISSVAFGR